MVIRWLTAQWDANPPTSQLQGVSARTLPLLRREAYPAAALGRHREPVAPDWRLATPAGLAKKIGGKQHGRDGVMRVLIYSFF